MRIGIMGMAAMLTCAAGLGAQTLGNGLILILAGPPGSGKTTQAERLKKEYKVPFISAAVALKDQRGWTKTPKNQRGAMAGGALLSDEATGELMLEYIKKQDFKKGFILDGYPYTVQQAKALEAFAKELHLAPPVTILLEVSDAVVKQRMESRKRADDTAANIETRIAEYRDESKALREAYPGHRVMTVDATRSEAEVYAEIKKLLQAGK